MTQTCYRHAGCESRANPAMRQRFSDDLASLNRTREVADRCGFSLSQLRYCYPSQNRPDGKIETPWLRELTIAGAHQRYGERIPIEVMNQIERELLLIEELDFGGYFLSMWEIVQYCRRENILCQGRS